MEHTHIALTCPACRKAASDNKEMLTALKGAETWLSGWASAEPYLSAIRDSIAKAESQGDVMDKAKASAELIDTLERCREKLLLYRAQHSGEYIGGREFSALMQSIASGIVHAIDLGK